MKKRVLAAALVGLFVSSATLAQNSSFSKEQTAQIETIVHDYLLNNPQVLVEVSNKLQENQEKQLQQISKNAQKMIPSLAKELFKNPSSPVSANTNGSISIVEFFDYQCPHCKDMSAIINKLAQQNKDLRVVYKELPIFGGVSDFAAQAALAANKQGKYQAFHDALMQASDALNKDQVLAIAKQAGLNIEQLQKDMASPEIKQQLQENRQLAQKLQLTGTPAFVIAMTNNPTPNRSILIPGSTSADVLQNVINAVKA